MNPENTFEAEPGAIIVVVVKKTGVRSYNCNDIYFIKYNYLHFSHFLASYARELIPLKTEERAPRTTDPPTISKAHLI